MSIKFTIKCPESRSNSRCHWSVQYKRDRKVNFAVRIALSASKQMPKSHDKLVLGMDKPQRVVRFTRFFGGRSREMDFGNFVASCKPVLDSLKLDDKGVGLIYDDAPKYCREMYDQIKDKERAGQLEVEVT